MTAEELKRQVPTPDRVLSDLYGVEWSQNQAHCLFPERHNHGDRNKSLRYDPGKRRVFCASQQCFGEKGADAVGVIEIVDRLGFSEAAEKLARHYGISNGNGYRLNGHGPRGAEAPRPLPASSPKLADAVREQLSRDGWAFVAEGAFGPGLRQVRFEHKSKRQSGKDRPEKRFVWEHEADGIWYSGAGGRELPIYWNQVARERDQDGALLGLEGWGKADAASALGIAAFSIKEVTEKNAALFASFSRITIWPDRDNAGRKMAERVATMLLTHNPNVYVIHPPEELPQCGDIIDADQLGWTPERIGALIAEAKRFRILGAFGVRDIQPVCSYANTKIEYVFNGMLAEGTVNALTGDAGCGKSTYASYIANTVSKTRCVVILDRENPLSVVAERLARLGVQDGKEFKYWGGWCEVEPPAPDSAELVAWVKECHPKPLLIFDSFIAFHASGEENDAGETRRYMQAYRKLADLGATVLILHHSGKGESTKDYRGSSDIKASIDTGWHLANFGEGRLERLRLRAWKCRFAVASEVILDYRDGEFLSHTASASRTVQELLSNF